MKNVLCAIAAAIALVGCAREDGKGASAEAEVEFDFDAEKKKLERSMERAGREIREGAEVAGKKLEKAGEKLKEEFSEARDRLDRDDKAEIEVEVKKD